MLTPFFMLKNKINHFFINFISCIIIIILIIYYFNHFLVIHTSYMFLIRRDYYK